QSCRAHREQAHARRGSPDPADSVTAGLHALRTNVASLTTTLQRNNRPSVGYDEGMKRWIISFLIALPLSTAFVAAASLSVPGWMLRYVNLIWLAALLLSWGVIFVVWSAYHEAMQLKIGRLKAEVMSLEKKIEELKIIPHVSRRVT